MKRMTRTQYSAYLASDHWKQLRRELLDEASECERCNMPRWLAAIAYDQDLHLHHKHYRTLGAEECGDLEVLCARCHDVETHGRSELKAVKSAKCSFCGSTHWNYRAELCAVCDAVFCTPYLWWVADRQLPDERETAGDYIIRDIQRSRAVPADWDEG